jgi:predicted RNA methylase
MATLPLEPRDPRLPHVAVARALLDLFRTGAAIDRNRLRQLFEAQTGASDGSAVWTMRQAYESLELAQVLFLLDACCPLLMGTRRETLARLQTFEAALPVQSYRSEGQVALQQFSTPLPLAWLAGLAAGATMEDLVLEPSAGNGMLAWPAARGRARLILNEIDPDRLASLADAFREAEVLAHDAELIDDLLSPDRRPNVILMNPPFARSCGRGEDRHAAGRHLAAALARLQPGGRLVAIMPESFSEAGTGRALRAGVEQMACLRLDALLAPGAFARQGTGVAVRLVVYDKVATSGEAVRASVENLEELLRPLECLAPRLQSGAAPRPRAAPTLFARRSTPVAAPAVPALRASAPASVPLHYSTLDEPSYAGEQVGIYLPYRPSRIAIPGASPHPTPLVESIAMGSIAAPKPDHAPLLPGGLVERGLLSEAQLETLIYAGAAFSRELPGRLVPVDEGCALQPGEEGASYRCGYFLGDGTGAGKGRQVAGVILDQWLRGKGRHIWLSKNESLLEDARRDWSALGGLPLDIQPLSQWKLGTPVTFDHGILFVTYPTLRSGRADATRLRQIVDWAGAEFDGIIAFDEAHAMANAAGGEGSRGKVKGSEQGMAGVRLQNLLPRARVLYASATGASDVNNLAYAMRLGLWGPETAFAERDQFVAAIRQGGIAAMELVARDLKALGLYTARALSFAGVEYDVLEHALTPAQVLIYDAYADAWAIIHANLQTALEATRIVDAATGCTLNANAKSAALSRFEGTKQRFFGQLLLSMKLPSLIPAVEQDLASGQAVVVQLVSTAEAMLDRRLAELSPEEREALEIDLSPREYVIDYLTAAFPTRQMRVFTDPEHPFRAAVG